MRSGPRAESAPPPERLAKSHARRDFTSATSSGCSCSWRSPPSCSTTSARATSPRRRSRSLFAVALTVALWVGANLLFDQAYAHWTRFNTIIGAVARLPRLLRRRGQRLAPARSSTTRCGPSGQGVFDDVTGWSTRPFDVNWLLWGLIGGAALGLVMFLLSAPRQQLARLPLAVARLHRASGCSPRSPSTIRRGPALDWGKLLDLRRRRRGGVRADRPLAPRAAPRPRSRCITGARRRLAHRRVGRRRHRRRQLRRGRPRHRRAGGDLRRPLRARHRARRPEATAHRSALPLLDLRHAGAGVHRRRACWAR